MNSFDRIYAVVRRIPPGKVATYGQVALLAGNPRWSRVVGYALHVNPDPAGIPCFRVVNLPRLRVWGRGSAEAAARGRRRRFYGGRPGGFVPLCLGRNGRAGVRLTGPRRFSGASERRLPVLFHVQQRSTTGLPQTYHKTFRIGWYPLEISRGKTGIPG